MNPPYKLQPFLSTLFLLFLCTFSFFSFSKESVYTFNFEKGSYYGEMYHVALGLLAEPNAFVHLPFISHVPATDRVDQLKLIETQPQARQALLIYGFLKKLGLENRVLADTAAVPSVGKKIASLVGKNKPNGSGAFESPVVIPLADTTQALERFVDQSGENALKLATSLFTRSGSDPPAEVKDFITQHFSKISGERPLIALWNRQDPNYQIERNMSQATMTALINESILKGYTPMILGPPIDPNWKEIHQQIAERKVLDFTELWKRAPFNDWQTQVIHQLDFLRELKEQGKIVGQIGMKGGALDGPALGSSLSTIELVIPEDSAYQLAKSRRIIRFANAVGNMMILEVDQAGSVRDPYTSVPTSWLDLLLNPKNLRTSCKVLYEFLGLRVKKPVLTN